MTYLNACNEHAYPMNGFWTHTINRWYVELEYVNNKKKARFMYWLHTHTQSIVYMTWIDYWIDLEKRMKHFETNKIRWTFQKASILVQHRFVDHTTKLCAHQHTISNGAITLNADSSFSIVLLENTSFFSVHKQIASFHSMFIQSGFQIVEQCVFYTPHHSWFVCSIWFFIENWTEENGLINGSNLLESETSFLKHKVK